MILELVTAEYFATNCWIFAQSKGSECFIVDPGVTMPNMVAAIDEVILKYRLKPVATVVTHGHIDHTYSVKAFDDQYNVTTYIHPKDRPFLADPLAILSPGTASMPMFANLDPGSFSEPGEVKELTDGATLDLAGFSLQVRHAPGHTPGSTVFIVDDEYLIAGDVLFHNSIGRTDLPQGSMTAMKKTLSTIILKLADELVVLPGHGKETTIGRERKNNEFLHERFLKER